MSASIAAQRRKLKRRPGPPAIPIPWDKIKAEIVAHVPVAEVSKKYNVNRTTISIKSAKEGWPTPRMIAKLQRESRAKIPTDCTQPSEAQSVALSLEQLGQRNAMSVARKYSRALDDSAAPPIRTMKDAHLAVQIVQAVTGRDRPASQSMVQVNIGGWASSDRVDVMGEPL
jgi:hypothetical protein